MTKIKEDGAAGGGASGVGGPAPSNTASSGQVDMSPTKKLFKDLHRRTKEQRRQMDEYYINLFQDIIVKGK